MPCITACCCWNLRNGSIASAVYSMILAAIFGGLAAYKIDIEFRVETGPGSSRTGEQDAFFIATCVDLVFFTLLFFFSILLVYGVKNDKRYLFLPFLVCMVLQLALQTILIIVLCIILASSVFMVLTVILQLCIVIVLTLVNLYCVLCVTSYYQELRDGRAGIRAIYRAQGSTLPHVDETMEKCGAPNSVENANFLPPYPGPYVAGASPYPPAAAPSPYPAPTPSPYPVLEGAIPHPPDAELAMPPPSYQPPQYPALGYPKGEV